MFLSLKINTRRNCRSPQYCHSHRALRQLRQTPWKNGFRQYPAYRGLRSEDFHRAVQNGRRGAAELLKGSVNIPSGTSRTWESSRNSLSPCHWTCRRPSWHRTGGRRRMRSNPGLCHRYWCPAQGYVPGCRGKRGCSCYRESRMRRMCH